MASGKGFGVKELGVLEYHTLSMVLRVNLYIFIR